MRFLRGLIIALIGFSIVFGACNAKENKEDLLKQKAEAARNLSIFNQAKREAKSTYPAFIRQFENKKKSRAYNYSIRMAFNSFEGEEYVWLNDLRYDQGLLYGIVSKNPKNTKVVKKGDKVKIDETQLVDWMYFYRDKLHGGFTIKAARNQMTAAQKAKFDKSFPVKIEG